MGSPIFALLAGADQAYRGHWQQITFQDRAHPEHPAGAQSMIQHLAVALLEDEQGQEAAGEQVAVGQHHDWQRVWQN